MNQNDNDLENLQALIHEDNLRIATLLESLQSDTVIDELLAELDNSDVVEQLLADIQSRHITHIKKTVNPHSF